MPDTPEDRLESLLRRWHEQHLLGRTLSVEELCLESPHLIEEVRHRLGLEQSPFAESRPDATVTQPGTAAPAPDAPQWPRIEGYEIEGLLGHGGMGIVFRARQVRAERTVALKMLSNPGFLDDRGVERFLREARSLARIQHPNIVPVYEVGESHGQPWFTMEFLPGGNLHQKQGKAALAPREAAGTVEQIARAVHKVHERGILHRDLKPANVLLDADGTLKVADFGLAKDLLRDTGETPSGMIVGTPSYMAPEQVRGSKDVDVRVDVYALGAILYELLTGRPPFRGKTPADTMLDVLSVPPVPPTRLRKDLPRDLEAICLRCLAKAPGERYASAADLADDLARWQRGEPPVAHPLGIAKKLGALLRRPRVLVAGLVLLLLPLLLILLLLPGKDAEDPLVEIEKEIRRGERVRLFQEDGRSRWLRWPLTEAGTFRSGKDRDGCFVHSGELSLAMLLPSVPTARYRLEALVRHDDGGRTSDAGLFVALQSHSIPKGTIVIFWGWTFNDLFLRRPEGNSPELTCFACKYDDSADLPLSYTHTAGGGKNVDFAPALTQPGKGPWRELAVEVDGDSLRTSWDGKPVQSLATEEVYERVQYVAAQCKELQGAKVTFSPRGGLGLFLLRGSATFKSVTLQALENRR